MKALITIGFIFLNLIAVNAQSVLENYLALGLENNLALQQEELELQKSMEALNQAKANFLPDISFQASYLFAGGGRNIAIPVGDLLNPVYASLNSLTDTNQFPTNLENSSEQLIPNRFHDTRIQIRQPLFQPEIIYNLKARQSLVGVQQARRDVYRQELILQIKSGYYDYLTTVEALEIFRSTEYLLKELLRVNRKLVENDKATIDVVYRAEYELTELYSNIADAEQLRSRSKAYFNFLLNRDLGDSIHVDPNLVQTTFDNNLETLQETAVSHREELIQVAHAVEATQYLISVSKSHRLPSLSLGANAGYQGFDYTFDNQQDYYQVQLAMSFPIFTGFRNKSRIEERKIELSRLRVQEEELVQQIRFQVIDAYRAVEAAEFSLRAREASVKSAEKSFQIIARKYQENQITLLDLLDARTKYTTSQLEQVVARYKLLKSTADLERNIALTQFN